MVLQLIRESFALLRRPTLRTFQAQSRADVRAAVLYFALGTLIAAAAQSAATLIHAPSVARQQAQIREMLGASPMLALYDILQSPGWSFLIGVIGGAIGLALWLTIPYAIGRAFGGARAFERFATTQALFLTPITLLQALFAIILGSTYGTAFLVISLLIDAAMFYLIALNLHATMGLSILRAILALTTLIVLAVIVSCGLLILVVLAAAASTATR
jgi:hypothetical protein